MRIERQHRGLQILLRGGMFHLMQQLLVARVNAVKVTDGHGHRLKLSGFLQRTRDPHLPRHL
jgi:hypothetical protein